MDVTRSPPRPPAAHTVERRDTRESERAASAATSPSTSTARSAAPLTAAARAAVLGDQAAPGIAPTAATTSSSTTAGAARLLTAEQRALAGDAAKVAALLPKMLCDLGGVDRVEELGVRPLVASAGHDSLFNCLFGRDSIRMAMDLIDDYPAVAKATIVALAQLQGTKTNPKSEEEPGRIVHEYRTAEEAKKMLEFNQGISGWEFPYYGTVDATPLFVSLVGAYVARHGPGILDEDTNTGELSRARFGDAPHTVRDAVLGAVSFLERRIHDPRGGGYLWVQRANPTGIENQILEDSRDSVYYEDGRLHPTSLPYAPVAEQGYAYRALKDAAALLGGERGRALDDEARALQRRFVRDFWQDDLSTFAQAVGFDEHGKSTPMRTVASSPGQLLGTGILDDLDDLRGRLVSRLFQPDMLAGAGIRTKSTTAARFRAGGYHNGTVWPTISLEIKDGLLRSAKIAAERGRDDEARDLLAKAGDLEDRAIHAMAKFPFFPEFLRGDVDGSVRVNTERIRMKDRDGIENTLEQEPQPQGWTATAMERVLRRRGFLDGLATQQAA